MISIPITHMHEKLYIYIYIYIYISFYLIYNCVEVKKKNLILQFANSTNLYLEKNSVKKEKMFLYIYIYIYIYIIIFHFNLVVHYGVCFYEHCYYYIVSYNYRNGPSLSAFDRDYDIKCYLTFWPRNYHPRNAKLFYRIEHSGILQRKM